MENNNLTTAISVLSDKKMIAALSIIAVIAISVYVVGFSQVPVAHDTFHEVRHSLGLSCH